MNTTANSGPAGAAGPRTGVRAQKVAEAPEPIPTPDELVARAVALRPHLRAEQAATEKRGRPSKETHDMLVAAGFYKIFIPRKFGGYEYSLSVFQRVMMNVAMGCPSTGWFTAFGAGHALPLASFYPERAQREIFCSAGRFQSPHAARGDEATVRPVEGGWIVKGFWPYSSGIPYATHFMGTAKILNADGTPAENSPPRTVVVVVPADRFTMVEDWGLSLGMRGSGSNSVRVENAFIPTDYAIDWFAIDRTGPTPGTILHGNPLYLGRFKPSYSGESASVLIGAAKAALESYENILKTRTLVRPGVVSSKLRYTEIGHQRNFGAAMVMIANAEALMLKISETHEEYGRRWAEKGIPFSDEDEELLTQMIRRTSNMAADAMDFIFASAGTQATMDGEYIQRAFRDVSTIKTQAAIQFLDNVPQLARMHFGIAGGPTSATGG